MKEDIFRLKYTIYIIHDKRTYMLQAKSSRVISQVQLSIRFIGKMVIFWSTTHSPWGSWASDNGAFSQPPFPPPLIITLGPIPSLLVISLVVSGFSSFWFCVLAGDSDLCCSALATGIFITETHSTISRFLIFVHNTYQKIYDHTAVTLEPLRTLRASHESSISYVLSFRFNLTILYICPIY